jgi:hypothetical protein
MHPTLSRRIAFALIGRQSLILSDSIKHAVQQQQQRSTLLLS